MKRYFFLLTALVFTLCTGLQCRHEPEPDPCVLSHPTTADFDIAEYGGPSFPDHWVYYDADTLILNAVLFTAKEYGPGVKYEWVLGAETLHVRSFYRTDFLFDIPINISLKVSKIPNTECFPLDDGKEEKTRSFYIKSGLQSLVHGKFRGVNLGNPTDTFVVEFDTDSIKVNDPKIIGFPFPGCISESDNDFGVAYKGLYFGNNLAWDCSRPMGIARITGDHNEKLRFEYSIQVKSGVEYVNHRTNKIFVGTRIP